MIAHEPATPIVPLPQVGEAKDLDEGIREALIRVDVDESVQIGEDSIRDLSVESTSGRSTSPLTLAPELELNTDDASGDVETDEVFVFDVSVDEEEELDSYVEVLQDLDSDTDLNAAVDTEVNILGMIQSLPLMHLAIAACVCVAAIWALASLSILMLKWLVSSFVLMMLPYLLVTASLCW